MDRTSITVSVSLLCVVGTFLGSIVVIMLITFKWCLNMFVKKLILHPREQQEAGLRNTTTTTTTEDIVDIIPPSYSQILIEEVPPNYCEIINVKNMKSS